MESPPRRDRCLLGGMACRGLCLQSEVGGQYAVALYRTDTSAYVDGDFWFTMVCPPS